MAKKINLIKPRPNLLIIKNYLSNLEGLKVFIDNLTPIVKKHDQHLAARLKSSGDKIFQLMGIPQEKAKELKNKNVKIKLSKTQLIQLLEVLEESPKLKPHNAELLHQSSFIMLTSYFDFLIADLIKYYYEEFPESLSGKELSLSLSELKMCNDIDEAKKSIVNKEIDRIMYKNITDQRLYFSNSLGVSYPDKIINWDLINEAIERRNVLVHNNGIINKRYLQNVNPKAVPEGNDLLKEGKQLNITDSYFTKTFDEFLLAGIILHQCCFRKWQPKDTASIDRDLNEYLYNFLKDEKWQLAEKLGLFSKEQKLCDEIKLYIHINYCQSLKWQGKTTELQTELAKLGNTSNLSPLYQMCFHCLKSEKELFLKNLRGAIVADEFTKSYFDDWPLFKEFRKDNAFKQKVYKAFKSRK